MPDGLALGRAGKSAEVPSPIVYLQVRGARPDLGRYGIRVNSVHPGWIDTNLTANRADKQLDTLAMGRTGHPTEVAALVAYLAGDESSYSTGAEFVVDGGQTAGAARA